MQSHDFFVADEFVGNISSVIAKVRKVVKLFKNSPVKNDTFLQKHVKQDPKIGHELNLILDSKTRWSSLLACLERFLKLQKPVRLALTEMESSITFSDREIAIVDELVKALGPAKDAVEALCR